MRIARVCGIPCEQVSYYEFCGVPAIIATRYDRVVTKAAVVRIHQEDLCQALGVMPDKKYAEDGGPSTPDVLRLLKGVNNPSAAIEAFAAMLFFNYLTCSPDAHAKNYSLMHLSQTQCVMAPLYDVASALPYDLTEGRPLRMAMSIGGENRQGRVRRAHVEKFADMAGMQRTRALDLMANLCARVSLQADAEAEQLVASGAQGAEELVDRLVPRLQTHCARIMRQM